MSDTHTKTHRNQLYDTDFYAWTQEQAQLLRERRFDDLDLDNLVDEVQSVGSSEKREIRRRLRILLTHLLKWKLQPGMRGNSWRRTIREQREAIAEIVQGSPSLQSYVLDAVHAAYIAATVAASEETGLAIGIFPEECPFDPHNVLGLEFFPEDRELE
ncbi:MAG TPA: DUF29 domain-containing protein [Xanthobacteraceae bacterium]|jgi:hypothetical protein